MTKLDAEEREILEAFETDQLNPIENKDAELKKHREYAAATFKKDQRINIRISSRDLQAIKKRALSEGIPYQTLIASVLHKYVDDRLVDREYFSG
ncbi:MAG: antitoxin [Chloroflexi bacterium]|nr:antitoxin [Chloroflexota bacterium]